MKINKNIFIGDIMKKALLSLVLFCFISALFAVPMKKGLMIKIQKTKLQNENYVDSLEFKRLVESTGTWEEVSAASIANEIKILRELKENEYDFFKSKDYYVFGCWLETEKDKSGNPYIPFIFDVISLREDK